MKKTVIILTICLSASQLFDRDCKNRCEFQGSDYATRNGKCYCAEPENMKQEIVKVPKNGETFKEPKKKYWSDE